MLRSLSCYIFQKKISRKQFETILWRLTVVDTNAAALASVEPLGQGDTVGHEDVVAALAKIKLQHVVRYDLDQLVSQTRNDHPFAKIKSDIQQDLGVFLPWGICRTIFKGWMWGPISLSRGATNSWFCKQC